MSPLENLYSALIESNFGNLRRHGFSFALRESTSVGIAIEAIGENIAIRWSYDIRDNYMKSYVLPAQDGIVDMDYYVNKDTPWWELATYCREVFNVSEAKLDAIEKRTFARQENMLQCTLAYYKAVFVLLGVEQLKEGRFPPSL